MTQLEGNTVKEMKVLAIPGSLREESLTRQLARSLQTYAPEGMEIEVFDLHEIPIFNQDVEDVGFPPSVQALREAIEASDGIIFATPEYNGAMSGVIKNGVDWASRKKLLGKRPATVISGSPGSLGATKAQESLRAVLNHLGMYVLARPSLAVPKLNEKIEEDQLMDETTEKFVRQWLKAFRDWIIQLNK